MPMVEENMFRRPEIIVFAGANGSGKSTLTEILLKDGIDYINADDIQRSLNCENIEAAKIAEGMREMHILSGQSFCFETVLSTERNLNLLERAKKRGFFIKCYYVLTRSPSINKARVLSRVSAGGHSVPEDKIVSRWNKTLDLLPQLISICDVCHVYDNSDDTPKRLFKKKFNQINIFENPKWSKQKIEDIAGFKDLI